MNKYIKALLLSFALFAPLGLFAQQTITGVLNESATGTTSATVFVDAADGVPNITDLSWRVDTAVTTGLVVFRPGNTKYAITSATTGAASDSIITFANTGTGVSVGSYVIIYDESAGTYTLRQVQGASTTSITLAATFTTALTTSDSIWSTIGSFERPVQNINSATTAGPVNIWLPAGRPTAVTLDGNTTSCRIQLSGVRRRN